MREILFRGQHTETGEWWYGDLFHTNKRVFIRRPNSPTTYEHYSVKPETVGQYIGLTDKNGKKIFEGDIINTYTIYGTRDYNNAVVRLDDVLMSFMADNHSLYGGAAADIYEVIGNIHDTPELLEREEVQ